MHKALHTGWLLGWLLLGYFMMDRFEEQLCCQSHQAMECHGMLWISCFTVIVHVVFCAFYDNHHCTWHGMDGSWSPAFRMSLPVTSVCHVGATSHEAPAKHGSKGYEKNVLTHFDVKQSEFNDFQPHAESRVHQSAAKVPSFSGTLVMTCDVPTSPLLACPGSKMPHVNTFKCSCSTLLAVRQYLSRLAASMPDIQTGLDSLDKECPSWTTLRS